MNNESLYSAHLFKMTKFRIAQLRTENIDVIKNALQHKLIDGVEISPHIGFEGASLDILKELPNLHALGISNPDHFDCTVLGELSELKYLRLADRKKPINFGVFSKLINLQINWHPQDFLPSVFTELESLYIWSYKPKTKYLTELPTANRLKSLGFAHGNLINLKGIEKYPHLEELDLAYCTKLESVSALQDTPIERIHLTACKKIDDLASLAACPKLKSIRINNCRPMESLSFLNKFHTLEDFRFVDTDVIDGDLTPLLKMKTVGFLAKRHFSHTPQQVRDLIGDPWKP